MGLITRENGTWESVGQRLKNVLSPGQCFFMSLSLAHSNTYAGYKLPLKLRIWGGSERCERDQLLWESPLIEHREWKTYRSDFVPRSSMQYLIIEAYHQEGSFSYRGNVLIDRLSPIKKCIRALRFHSLTQLPSAGRLQSPKKTHYSSNSRLAAYGSLYLFFYYFSLIFFEIILKKIYISTSNTE